MTTCPITRWKQAQTSSSAVAKRPRDNSCLSVISFIASIVQYLERSFFIISYFGFGFTSAYNSILLCCLRPKVEPCSHTHDSLSTVIVYSARPRLVGFALWVIMRCAWWSNTRIKQSRPHARAIYKHRAAVIDRKARYSLIIEILTYPTCIRRPL